MLRMFASINPPVSDAFNMQSLKGRRNKGYHNGTLLTRSVVNFLGRKPAVQNCLLPWRRIPQCVYFWNA
jgi:hypothetical protein